MRSAAPRYPVDRYLDEISMKTGVVSIDDEVWEPAPALRPEDEVLLRRLHGVLRATAQDLAQLARQLAPRPPPAPTAPPALITPLDEDFNQKVHIERVVDAKFHGHKLNNPLDTTFTVQPRIDEVEQVNTVPVVKQPKVKNLSITRTRIIEIDEKPDKNTKNRLNNDKVINKTPPATFKEFTFKYEEPELNNRANSKFKIQDMPSINIRSELKEQKVLQLDIYPDSKQSTEDVVNKANVAVVAIQHEIPVPEDDPRIILSTKNTTTQVRMTNNTQACASHNLKTEYAKREPVRKISKMSACESSGSVLSSDTQQNIKTQKKIKSVIKSSPRLIALERRKTKKYNNIKNESETQTHFNLDEWKRKINAIYGRPSTSQRNKLLKNSKKTPKQLNVPSTVNKPEKNLLNNAEYIPYSRLTLGGAQVSDIEREISNIPNKSDIPLSPILDKILSSKENSPRKGSAKESPRIFTTSDENLLQEVINIEKKVRKINKSMKVKLKAPEEPLELPLPSKENKIEESKDEDSYANDFEEDQSDDTKPSKKKDDSVNLQLEHQSDKTDNYSSNDFSDNEYETRRIEEPKTRDEAFVKKSNLAIKNSIDIFEFVHLVDTQETATQSNRTHKISLKETQTSPRNEKPNIQPIHNDLWPMDPQGEVEKMFKLEKDFIKKLIVEEYGDILERNITKPSTSRESCEVSKKNVTALQKVTQTSPAHVKSVMTSPTRTKTQTTSPFFTVRVDHQTSPFVVVTNEEHLTLELDNDDDGISINLSSPRFSLQLPQTSREVLSNLDIASASSQANIKSNNIKKIDIAKHQPRTKMKACSSSSEIESSSEMSSLGEVKLQLKRRHKYRELSISESSDTSSLSLNSLVLPSVGMIPLRSEGELSLSVKQNFRKVKDSKKTNKSEGETSLGRSK